jgi:predicted alpha/beta-fold hydrolase
MVAAHVQQRFPDSKLLAMGWSLGANILVRYLGQVNRACPLFLVVLLKDTIQQNRGGNAS